MGTNALVLVPSLDLLRAHQDSFQKHMPGVRVGVLSGTEKNPQPNGITIATYNTIQRMFWQDGTLPPWLRHIPIVFADEAHRSMSELRSELIKKAFDPATERVALTATPDFNEDRILAEHYPKLIHEMSFTEARARALIAEPRVWIDSVAVDASSVSLENNQFKPEELGRVMGVEVVFKTIERIRFSKENAQIGTLVRCSTVAEAYALQKFLHTQDPSRKTTVHVIVGTTSPDQRATILHTFEENAGHTIIVVRGLLEGWNSPRCKMLIDGT